jgi:hypothetical protein
MGQPHTSCNLIAMLAARAARHKKRYIGITFNRLTIRCKRLPVILHRHNKPPLHAAHFLLK